MSAPDRTNAILEALAAEDRREDQKKFTLSSTVNFAKMSGSNVYDAAMHRYPWIGFQEEMAGFIDRPVTSIAKPIYLVAVPRGHLKTEIGVNFMCRHVILHPESRNGICGATTDRGEANLRQVNQILLSKSINKLFPKVLYPAGTKARFHYTATMMEVIRRGHYREPTISAFGTESNTTGMHFGEGSVLWFDDIVTPQNVTTPENREKVWVAFQYLYEAVCDPGCRVVVTFTRYDFDDVYARLLAPGSKYRNAIVEKPIIKGCFLENQITGKKEALYPARYCLAPEECGDSWQFRGETYYSTRESLEEKRRRMKPGLFAAQFLNQPMADDELTFKESYFNNIMPVPGDGFVGFMDDPKTAITIDGKNDARGPLVFGVLADYAYTNKTVRQGDYNVSVLICQDAFNHYYVVHALRTRDGWRGIEAHFRTALRWKRGFEANKLGIETHAHDEMRWMLNKIAREEGEHIHIHNLKNNSSHSKIQRIGVALEPIARDGRLHFCNGKNVEKFRKATIEEALQFPQNRRSPDCLDVLANIGQVFRPRSIKNRANSWDMYDRSELSPNIAALVA